jgi:hypothetical protein
MAFQYLFEIGQLEKIFGYTDWQLYRLYLLDLIEFEGSFYYILDIFKNISANPQYYIYFIIDIFWPYWFARVQFFYFSRSIFVYIFILLNPLVFLMFAGIFKESIIFIFLVLGFYFYRKFPYYFFKFNIIFSVFLIPVLFVRPHLFAVFFALSRYSTLFIIFASCIFVMIIVKLGFFDFKFIEASMDALNAKGYADMNLYVIQNIGDMVYLPANILIFTLYFLSADNLIIAIYGFMQFLSGMKLLQLTKKHYKLKVIVFFAGLCFIYSFLVVVSGTAFRLISIAWFLVAIMIYTLKYDKPKLGKKFV